MKKLLFGAVVLAVLVGCSTDDQMGSKQVNDGKTITFKAGFAASTSRVTAASDGNATEGIKVTWNSTDKLLLCSSAESVTSSVAVVDATDAHKATFTGTFKETPTNIYAYASTGAITIVKDYVKADLKEQDGSMKNAVENSVIYGAGIYDADNADVSMAFKHKLAFLKLVLTLPSTETETAADALVIKGTGVYNMLQFTASSGEVQAKQEGDINITGTTALTVTDHKVTAYIAINPGMLKDASAELTLGDNVYSFGIAGSTGKTYEAGYLYTVARENPVIVTNKDVWTTDAAYSGLFTVSGTGYTVTSSASWLTTSDSNGTISVVGAANTTGAPRQAQVTVTYPNGQTCTYSVTQIERKDIAGNYSMQAFKVFHGTYNGTTWSLASTENPTVAGNDSKIYDGITYPTVDNVTISIDETNTTKYADQAQTNAKTDGTHVNDLLIGGLYKSLNMKAEYNATNHTVGIFLQDIIGTMTADSNYPEDATFAGLMPELITTGGTWRLDFAGIGGCKNFWYLGNVKVTGNKTAIVWRANNLDGRQNLSTSTSYNVAGILVCPYTTSDRTLMAGGTSTADGIAGTVYKKMNVTSGGKTTYGNVYYEVVYQGDMVFTKK